MEVAQREHSKKKKHKIRLVGSHTIGCAKVHILLHPMSKYEQKTRTSSRATIVPILGISFIMFEVARVQPVIKQGHMF